MKSTGWFKLQDMPYDAEETRRRIFDAAVEEFARHGLAGARVDRIAKAAEANKQAIYLYFGNKEQLFGTVVNAKLDELCNAVALDPSNLAESVGRLFDWECDHPEVVRLLLWEGLEYGDQPVVGEAERTAGYRDNVASLLPAGADEDDVDAARDWVYTVMGLIAWNFTAPQLRRQLLNEPDTTAALRRRRATVIGTVTALAPPL
jgi:AcrR family transcriptional regulator